MDSSPRFLPKWLVIGVLAALSVLAAGLLLARAGAELAVPPAGSGFSLLPWLRAAVLLLFPLGILLPVLVVDREAERRAYVSWLLSWIVGCLLSLYASAMADRLLPEFFGAFFTTCFLALLALTVRERRWALWRTLSLVALLSLASVVRGPFLLSAAGGALLLLRTRRDAIHVGIAVLGAVVVSVLAWVVLAALQPAAGLPFVLGGQPLPADAAWGDTVHFLRIWHHLSGFSPFFPWALAVAWLGSLAFLLSQAENRRERLGVALRWLLGTWLHAAAAGVSADTAGSGFIFAVPLYAAAFLLCVQLWADVRRLETVRWIGAIVLGVLVSLAVLTARSAPGGEPLVGAGASSASTAGARY